MSRVHQRVLRTVRLLPEAVRIGIAEPEPGASPADDETSGAGAPQEGEPFDISGSGTGGPGGAEPKLPEPDKELLERITALEGSLSGLEAQNSELAAAKAKLESEIGGIRADYESRKRAIEADAAANAARAAEEARTRGHEEGWNAGHTEGLSAARSEVEKEYLEKFSGLVSVLENVGQRLEEKFSELVALNQPRMIRVWSEMLKRMLQRQVELHPDTIDSVLSTLLTRLSDKNQIVIYVSPDDIAHLEADMDKQFQEVLRGVHRLELKADPNVDRGSCIVETSLGVYDARWKTQMAQVESVIDGIFQQVAKEEQNAASNENSNKNENENTDENTKGNENA